MLVLSRKVGERVMIGDTIELFVVEIRGDRVRLGFAAPQEVVIDRREVFEDKQRQAAQAQEPGGADAN